MFLGFWSWVLLALIIVAIFYADKLPAFKEIAGDMAKKTYDKAYAKYKEYEERMCKKIEQRDEKIYNQKSDEEKNDSDEPQE